MNRYLKTSFLFGLALLVGFFALSYAADPPEKSTENQNQEEITDDQHAQEEMTALEKRLARVERDAQRLRLDNDNLRSAHYQDLERKADRTFFWIQGIIGLLTLLTIIFGVGHFTQLSIISKQTIQAGNQIDKVDELLHKAESRTTKLEEREARLDKAVEPDYKADKPSPPETKPQPTTTVEGTYNNDFESAWNAIEQGKWEEASNLFGKIAEEYSKSGDYSNWGTALMQLGILHADESSFKLAIEKFEKANTLTPKSPDILTNWANSCRHYATYLLNNMNEEMATQFFVKAFEKYELAARLNPLQHEAFNNWGTALSDYALHKEDLSVFYDALSKFKRALKIKRNKTITYFNLSKASTLASKFATSSAEKESLLKKGSEAYERYLELKEQEKAKAE